VKARTLSVSGECDRPSVETSEQLADVRGGTGLRSPDHDPLIALKHLPVQQLAARPGPGEIRVAEECETRHRLLSVTDTQAGEHADSSCRSRSTEGRGDYLG